MTLHVFNKLLKRIPRDMVGDLDRIRLWVEGELLPAHNRMFYSDREFSTAEMRSYASRLYMALS